MSITVIKVSELRQQQRDSRRTNLQESIKRWTAEGKHEKAVGAKQEIAQMDEDLQADFLKRLQLTEPTAALTLKLPPVAAGLAPRKDGRSEATLTT